MPVPKGSATNRRTTAPKDSGTPAREEKVLPMTSPANTNGSEAGMMTCQISWRWLAPLVSAFQTKNLSTFFTPV